MPSRIKGNKHSSVVVFVDLVSKGKRKDAPRVSH
jgi:hypothetical protein